MAENADNLALEILEKVCETDEIAEDPEMDLFDAGLIDSLSTISIILDPSIMTCGSAEKRATIQWLPRTYTKAKASEIVQQIRRLMPPYTTAKSRRLPPIAWPTRAEAAALSPLQTL